MNARIFWGFLAIVGVIIFGISNYILTCFITGEFSFDKPFFLMYFGTSWMCLSCVPYLSFWHKQQHKRPFLKPPPHHPFNSLKISFKTWARKVLPLTIVWFGSGYAWYRGIPLTNLASATALNQTSAVFVFLYSLPLLHRPGSGRPTIAKALCLSVFIAGVVLMFFGDSACKSTNDSGHRSTAWLGDTLMLVSSALFSLYEVLLKLWVSDLPGSTSASMANALAWVGFTTLVGLFPGLIILDMLDVEELIMPSTQVAWAIVLNAAVSFSLNYLAGLAIHLTSPFIVQMGSCVNVPLAAILGWIIFGQNLAPFSIAGAACILLSFAASAFLEARQAKENYAALK